MKQLKILWNEPSDLFSEVIEEIELIGHKVIKNFSPTGFPIKDSTFNFVINPPKDLQHELLCENVLFFEHSYVIKRDNQNLPSFFSISAYDLNNKLVIHDYFVEERTKKEFIDIIVDFFVEYSRTNIIPKVRENLYLNKLKLDEQSSLNLLFSTIKLVYGLDKATLIEGIRYPNIGLYKISEVDFTSLKVPFFCLALRWDIVSSGLYNISSIIQISLDHSNSYEIIHVCKNNSEKRFLEYLLNVRDNKKQFLSEEEQNMMTTGIRNIVFANSSIIDEVYNNVINTPNRIAVEDNNSALTYLQLWQQVEEKSKNILLNNKDISGKPIAIGMHKSCELIVCLLSILRCGAYYVPLDPTYPSGKIGKILSISIPKLTIVDEQFKKKHLSILSEFNVIKYKDLKSQIYESIDFKFPASHDLCYVVFTSGSTGEPKGVMIEHHNVVNLARSESIALGIHINSRILSVASIGFDAAGWDIYGALINGCTVVIAPEQIQLNSVELSEFIINNNITIATLTPAVLATLSLDCAKSLDTLIVMGDKCSSQIMDRWTDYTKVMNGYGPTEATIGASLNLYSKGQSNLCIGKPLKNYEFLVMNENKQLVPDGVVGELYIAGAGLARGYFNANDLSNQFFIEQQILDQNIRLYRTGDLVFKRQDGTFEFIGRKDYQIKIRGIRIELEEIEKVLTNYDYVEHSVVKIEDNKRLVAYIQSTQEIKLTKINKYLANFLHPAAIPTQFFRVKKFNLTSNGKIDRNSIKDFIEIKSDIILLPHNPEQEFIYKVFQNVLKISSFSIRDNFFLLGGHSLTATNVIGQINKHFKAKLPVHLLFDNGTVEEIAEKIEQYISSTPPLTRSSERLGNLTFAQERLWYLYQLDQNDVSYNLPFVLEIKGNLSKSLLERSLHYIIKRHETFRTIFEIKESVKQKVLEDIDFILETKNNIQDIDLFIEEYCYKPFKLTVDLPFRICLIEKNKTEHLLVFILHNIITDAWSIGVIIKELLTKYQDIQSIHVNENTPLSFQILDVGNYEKQFRTKELKEKELYYWRKHLENHQVLNFPSKERPELLCNKGGSILYKFSSNTWQDIKRYSRSKNCTPFISLMTIMNMWLAKYSNQTDILIGTALSGREGVEIEKMSGFFVNTLPLRTIFRDHNNFDEILELTRQVVTDAITNQDATFEWIVEVSKAERFLNKNPLFNIMIILQNADENILPDIPNLKVSNYRVPAKYAMFDMVWNFKENKENLEVDLIYNETLHDANSIYTFLNSLNYFISIIVLHLDKSLKELSVVDQDQENKIIGKSFSIIDTFDKEVTIIDRIFESYNKLPNAIAVKDQQGSYTYKNLIETASLISQQIQKYTNGKNVGIGIYLERSFNLVASIIGVLMSGAYYVPLDPNYPKERVTYIISNAELKMIIVDQSYDFYKDYKTIDVSKLQFNHHSNHVLKKIILQGDLAYVIYTSGTTGLPKGVMISHKNIYNLTDEFCNKLDLNNGSEFLSITTVSFDIFALELFCPLMSGGIHHIVSSDVARNPVHLVNLINHTKPTHMQATPTMWRTIIEHIDNTKMVILCGGENLDKLLFEKFKTKYEKVYNVYGPTETTVWSTCSLIKGDDTISIGRPIKNTQCFILDENQQLCPFNVWGELVIAGDGVGKGYINNVELTKKVFQEVEIAGKKFFVYKTGDRAKLLNDGHIICSGRYDSQIKLRGNRIELQEIESIINQLEYVLMSAVKLWGNGNNAYLAAYVVLSNALNEEEAIELIKSQISKKLSPIMVPSNFQILESLPKTNNGKIDRKSLLEPIEKISLSENQFIHPQNDIEEFIKKIWEKVISITNISVTENFFVIGGNSIHIPQIVHELNMYYMLNLTIRDFILHSTIRELSEYIANKIIINV